MVPGTENCGNADSGSLSYGAHCANPPKAPPGNALLELFNELHHRLQVADEEAETDGESFPKVTR